MAESESMSESSSASSDGSRHWTNIVATTSELASLAALMKEHLDFIPEYDPFVVSLGRKIAEGAQGVVYEAKFYVPYSFHPLPVVVKKFKRLAGVSQGHFPMEMASANASNVCVPLGVWFVGDHLFMMMQRYSCDLRSAIDNRMRTLGARASSSATPSPFTHVGASLIIVQLAMGLKALHECGVYHRDLKAANILLRVRRNNYDISGSNVAQLVLADFERSDGVVGTGFFRAPEVLRSLLTRVPLSDEQWLMADMYSFGMVCYEVLTGSIPFDGKPQSDYDLVLKGARPVLPAHIPGAWRDLILRCWHADPQSRPSWNDVLRVFVRDDPAVWSDEMGNYVSDLVDVESQSFGMLILEAKHTIQTLVELRERESEVFRLDFMPSYWASEFVATAEEYASKFEIDSSHERPWVCGFEDFVERQKLFCLLAHQMSGSSFGLFAFGELYWNEDLILQEGARKIAALMERLHAMLMSVKLKVLEEFDCEDFTKDFKVGTSWMAKLLFFHALVKWILWYEHADNGELREIMMDRLWLTHCTLNAAMESLLMILCMAGNAYFYVLAMITCEPFFLGLQYWLYKIQGAIIFCIVLLVKEFVGFNELG